MISRAIIILNWEEDKQNKRQDHLPAKQYTMLQIDLYVFFIVKSAVPLPSVKTHFHQWFIKDLHAGVDVQDDKMPTLYIEKILSYVNNRVNTR